MAKQKKKRRQKRQHRNNVAAKKPESRKAHIYIGSTSNADEIIAAFESMERESYDEGREDRASGYKAMTLLEFAKEFADLPFPIPMKADITETNYDIYMDGYNGRPFESGTVFEKDW